MVTRKLPPSLAFGRFTWGGASFMVKKREDTLIGDCLAWGSWNANWKPIILGNWFGKHICLSLVGAELKVCGGLWRGKKKKKEAGSHWPNPNFWSDCCRDCDLTSQVVCPPKRLCVRVVYDLVIVYLYNQSLTTEEQIDLMFYDFITDYILVALRVLSGF